MQNGDHFLVYSIYTKVDYASDCGWKTILGKRFDNNRLAVYGNYLLPTNVKGNVQICEVSNYRLYHTLVEQNIYCVGIDFLDLFDTQPE